MGFRNGSLFPPTAVHTGGIFLPRPFFSIHEIPSAQGGFVHKPRRSLPGPHTLPGPTSRMHCLELDDIESIPRNIEWEGKQCLICWKGVPSWLEALEPLPGFRQHRRCQIPYLVLRDN